MGKLADDVNKLHEKISRMTVEKKRNFAYKELANFVNAHESLRKFTVPVASNVYVNENLILILMKNDLSPAADEPPPEMMEKSDKMEYKSQLMDYLSRWGIFKDRDISSNTYYLLAQYCYHKSRNGNA